MPYPMMISPDTWIQAPEVTPTPSASAALRLAPTAQPTQLAPSATPRMSDAELMQRTQAAIAAYNKRVGPPAINDYVPPAGSFLRNFQSPTFSDKPLSYAEIIAARNDAHRRSGLNPVSPAAERNSSPLGAQFPINAASALAHYAQNAPNPMDNPLITLSQPDNLDSAEQPLSNIPRAPVTNLPIPPPPAGSTPPPITGPDQPPVVQYENQNAPVPSVADVSGIGAGPSVGVAPQAVDLSALPMVTPSSALELPAPAQVPAMPSVPTQPLSPDVAKIEAQLSGLVNANPVTNIRPVAAPNTLGTFFKSPAFSSGLAALAKGFAAFAPHRQQRGLGEFADFAGGLAKNKAANIYELQVRAANGDQQAAQELKGVQPLTRADMTVLGADRNKIQQQVLQENMQSHEQVAKNVARNLELQQLISDVKNHPPEVAAKLAATIAQTQKTIQEIQAMPIEQAQKNSMIEIERRKLENTVRQQNEDYKLKSRNLDIEQQNADTNRARAAQPEKPVYLDTEKGFLNPQTGQYVTDTSGNIPVSKSIYGTNKSAETADKKLAQESDFFSRKLSHQEIVDTAKQDLANQHQSWLEQRAVVGDTQADRKFNLEMDKFKEEQLLSPVRIKLMEAQAKKASTPATQSSNVISTIGYYDKQARAMAVAEVPGAGLVKNADGEYEFKVQNEGDKKKIEDLHAKYLSGFLEQGVRAGKLSPADFNTYKSIATAPLGDVEKAATAMEIQDSPPTDTASFKESYKKLYGRYPAPDRVAAFEAQQKGGSK